MYIIFLEAASPGPEPLSGDEDVFRWYDVSIYFSYFKKITPFLSGFLQCYLQDFLNVHYRRVFIQFYSAQLLFHYILYGIFTIFSSEGLLYIFKVNDDIFS